MRPKYSSAGAEFSNISSSCCCHFESLVGVGEGDGVDATLAPSDAMLNATTQPAISHFTPPGF
jgi:hypothetical protein